MPLHWKQANPLGALKLLRRHRELLGLAGVSFLYQLAHMALPSVTVLYAGYRYGWDTRTMGLTLAAMGIGTIIVNATLVQPAVTILGHRLTLLLGLVFGASGFAIYGFAPSSEQGQLQGANASIIAVAGVLGPGLFTLILPAPFPSVFPARRSCLPPYCWWRQPPWLGS
jgi:DHA1 family tetracycline resistance protein-like MFS transporter